MENRHFSLGCSCCNDHLRWWVAPFSSTKGKGLERWNTKMKVDRKDQLTVSCLFFCWATCFFRFRAILKAFGSFGWAWGFLMSFPCEGDLRNFRLTTWEAGNHGKFDIICHTQVTMVPTSNYWLVSWVSVCFWVMVRTRRVCRQKSSSSPSWMTCKSFLPFGLLERFNYYWNPLYFKKKIGLEWILFFLNSPMMNLCLRNFWDRKSCFWKFWKV